MKIHHFGYAVKNINKSIHDFEILGYIPVGAIVEDKERQVKILFIEKAGVSLELIEPLSKESPINDILKKNGNSLYHICYESDDFDRDVNHLKENKFLLVEEANEAPAIGNRKVCFLYKKNIGLLEIVEE